IALVETRTLGDDGSPKQLIRYQVSNRLSSVSLELDDSGLLISYEEYYSYGSISYQAVRSQTQTPKRYRYTGTERDAETGLRYHSARYYAPWLGKWASADPIGLAGGENLYVLCRDNPWGWIDDDGKGPKKSPGSPDGPQAMGGLMHKYSLATLAIRARRAGLDV